MSANPSKKRHRSGQAASPAAPSSPTGLLLPPAIFCGVILLFAVAACWRAAHGIPWAALYSDWASATWAVIPAPPALKGHLSTMALTLWMTLAIIGYGGAALNVLRPKALSNWEYLAFAYSLGYGLTGTAWLLLGLSGFLLPPFMIALAFLGAVRGFIEARRVAAEWTPGVPGAPRDFGGRIFLALVGLTWAYGARFAMVPETFYDALIYHLGLPNLYLNAGKIFPTPENSFSGIPSLPEMLNAWTMGFDRWGTVANLLHASVGLWICAAFIGTARRLGRPRAGPMAAAFFCLCPAVLAEGFRVSVGLEWALMQFCFVASLLGLLKGDDSHERVRWAVLAGLFLGFAMATKYPAWLSTIALLPLLMPSRPLESGSGGRLTGREFAVIVGAAGLVLLPWVLKNVFFYGNPVYPFFHEQIQSAAAIMPDWRQIGTPSLDFRERFFTLKGLGEWIAHPWQFLSPGEEISESVGPLPLGLLPLLFLVRHSDFERKLILILVALWLPLSMLSEIPRFFIPHIAVMAFTVAFIGAGLTTGASAVLIRSLPVGISIALALAWPLLASGQTDKMGVFTGRRLRDVALVSSQISYPTPQFAGIQFINEHTAPQTTVLLFGDARGMYLRRKYVASSPDQTQLLVTWANSSPDAKSLLERLSEMGITHVLFNPAELTRRRVNLPLSPHGKATLDDFWKNHTKLLQKDYAPPDRWVEVRAIVAVL